MINSRLVSVVKKISAGAVLWATPQYVLAQTQGAGSTDLSAKLKSGISRLGLDLRGGRPSDAPEAILGTVLGALMGFLGMIFFGLILYAGILWMTAAGNENKVERAKKIIISSAIGLIVIGAAYVITVLIFTLVVPTND